MAVAADGLLPLWQYQWYVVLYRVHLTARRMECIWLLTSLTDDLFFYFCCCCHCRCCCFCYDCHLNSCYLCLIEHWCVRSPENFRTCGKHRPLLLVFASCLLLMLDFRSLWICVKCWYPETDVSAAFHILWNGLHIKVDSTKFVTDLFNWSV